MTIVITAFERSPDGGPVARGEARPAYGRAFAAQLALNAPGRA